MTVARFGSNENLTLWAREKGGDWAQLSFSNYGTGKDWDFVSNTVDLSAYAGKTLQFAYKYVSTDTGASTWEIKNVEVKEQGAAATLSSIAWTGYTTTYTVGDKFKADGTVTATYSDGSTKDVTSEASFSTPDMSTAGAKTVTITYEGETTTGEITVKDSGSTGGEPKTWTYALSGTTGPELNEDNPATVNGATWSITMGDKVGSPSTNGTPTKYSGIYGWKWGDSKDKYWSSYTLSTDYFASKKVKSVTVNFLNNGSKSATMIVKQGETTIGTATQEFGQKWTDLTANTTQGTGGTLTIIYSVAQASLIHSITVEYYE